jgi:3-phenylpropionate/trans-cinnamate dioxygenase ferredoxin subunit
MARWVTVAKASELEPGGHRTVEVDGEPIAVFHIGGKFHAIQDVCTHDGGILTGGKLRGTVITCPRHGAQFDLTTGAVLQMPAVEPVPTYEVRVEGDDVQVLFED